MATTLTPSPNTKHWWPRITAGRLNHHNDQEHLFTALNIGGRPQTSSGTSRSAWMVPVMNLSSTSFSSSNKSSRFNLAAVFGSKSKRRHPVDIQDPPSHIRSLPDTHSDPTRRLSRAVTSTSGASTDAPLTPSDPPPSFGLTDLTDPFISTSPLSDRRSSTHSDKSLSKRLIHTKTTKSITRLPVGEPSPKRRESRDRSSTLPSRAKALTHETYQPLRAVEPPWAPPQDDSNATVRQSKSNKPGLPWSGHHRTHSSSSISDDNRTVNQTHHKRPSTSSSIPVSPSPSTFTSHFSINSHHADILPLLMPLSSPSPSRAKPRPPPTSGLPPTPTPPEQHALRSRSGTDASTSAVSFASSLSSLSFNSPSPQEPPSAGGAHDYPSLLNESLPVPGLDDVIPRRSSNSGSSSRSYKDDNPPPQAKPSKPALPPASRHVQSPSVSSSSSRRDRVLSPTPEVGKTVRRQRSFHNTSLNAPTPLQPTLRHYNSFDPPSPPNSSGQGRAPPPPPLRSPPLPPSQDLPPLPSSAVSISKRGSTGKDSISMTSPRRRLFGVNRHERKQELENVDTNVTLPGQIQNSASSSASASASASSWFDERGVGSEPASASSTTTSIAQDVAQHIVPPAELLRLGAEWERERNGNGLRRAKSSWTGGTRGSSSKMGSSRSGEAHMGSNGGGSKLPRSASLLSKATSAPSFSSRADETAVSVSASVGGGGASGGSRSADGHTSLSPPPPRRTQRSIVRNMTNTGFLSPPPPRRAPSSASAVVPPKGALIERKPSFLDMSSRQSVTLDVPPPPLPLPLARHEHELERDSFLELSSREPGTTIETIRESMSSVDSFMEEL